MFSKCKILVASLATLATLAFAGQAMASDGIEISSATVNPNGTVTVNWTITEERTYGWPVYVDGDANFPADYGADIDATTFTTKKLSPGNHVIKVTGTQFFYSNTYYSSLNCDISVYTDDYLFRCSSDVEASVTVTIPTPLKPCVVPNVKALGVTLAKARIVKAGCTVGKITKVKGKGSSGVVVTQSYKAGAKLPNKAIVDLKVSR